MKVAHTIVYKLFKKKKSQHFLIKYSLHLPNRSVTLNTFNRFGPCLNSFDITIRIYIMINYQYFTKVSYE